MLYYFKDLMKKVLNFALGDTALHIAARLSHKECVTTLVNSGASVRLPNKTGKLCIDVSSVAKSLFELIRLPVAN